MKLRKNLKFSDRKIFLELEAMENRTLHLGSTDWDSLVSRWRISIESYYSLISGDERTASLFPGRAYAVYGEVDSLGRVLLFVVTRQQTTFCAEEIIESCLRELNPSLAEELNRDIGSMLKILCFSNCEKLEKLNNLEKASS